jgi:GNAT superfamily N-acetyltransferase
MQDMLVRLYDLPDYREDNKKLSEKGIVIRRAMAPDKHNVLEFVGTISSPYAKSEADVAFSRQPISLYIATIKNRIIGYACFNATYLNFFGPTAVLEEFRGQGVGKALLLTCLEQMYHQGYAYAIIGGVGPKEFYEKTCNAMLIEGSNPGIYKDFLGFL